MNVSVDEHFKKLYRQALNYLSSRLRTESEMSKKIDSILEKVMVSEVEKDAIKEKVINQLKKDIFLDDKRFASEWTASRLRNRKGPQIIALELRQKGVSREIIEEQLSQLSQEEEGDEKIYQSALITAQKYYKKIAQKEPYEQKFKLKQHLMSRGFDYKISDRAVDHVLNVS